MTTSPLTESFAAGWFGLIIPRERMADGVPQRRQHRVGEIIVSLDSYPRPLRAVDICCQNEVCPRA